MKTKCFTLFFSVFNFECIYIYIYIKVKSTIFFLQMHAKPELRTSRAFYALVRESTIFAGCKRCTVKKKFLSSYFAYCIFSSSHYFFFLCTYFILLTLNWLAQYHKCTRPYRLKFSEYSDSRKRIKVPRDENDNDDDDQEEEKESVAESKRGFSRSTEYCNFCAGRAAIIPFQKTITLFKRRQESRPPFLDRCIKIHGLSLYLSIHFRI